MQTSPNPHGRLKKIKATLRDRFIKIGLVPPPDVSNQKEKQISREQEQAQRDLRFHQQRKPRYW